MTGQWNNNNSCTIYFKVRQLGLILLSFSNCPKHHINHNIFALVTDQNWSERSSFGCPGGVLDGLQGKHSVQ